VKNRPGLTAVDVLVLMALGFGICAWQIVHEVLHGGVQ
jgi:hypothetical protein